MFAELLHGCDVSKYQSSTLVAWKGLDFGIARATYGKWADPQMPFHVGAMRAANVLSGLYAFFRADQDVEEQVATFFGVSELAHVGAGDLIPWVDVEDFGAHKISSADVAALEEFVDALDRIYCCDAGIYISRRDWIRLGKPGWILERPLWVAHYAEPEMPPLSKPSTPNDVQWRIWQYLICPLGTKRIQAPTAAGAVDQDVAIAPLPTIPAVEPTTAPFDPRGADKIPWLGLQDEDWQEMVAARDHTVLEEDEKNT